MARLEFNLGDMLIKAKGKFQADLFYAMFDELDTDFESIINIFGISVQEDED